MPGQRTSILPGSAAGDAMKENGIRSCPLAIAAAIFLLFLPSPGVFAQDSTARAASAESGNRDSDPVPSASAGKSQEGKTRLKRFPQNLGRNFLALFDKDNLAPLAVGAAASGIAIPLDHRIHDHYQDASHSTAFTDAGAALGSGYILAPAIGGLVLAGHYSGNDRFHSYSYAPAQGCALNACVSSAIKFSVRRTRPDGSDNLSFPSTHASSLFTIATVTEHYYGKTAGIIGYGIAGYVAISRVAKDVHWTSDVVAGSVLGYIVGRTVSRGTGVVLRPHHVTVPPGFDPGEKAYSLILVLRFGD
jgi:membrane-associated phospholipid phosphatase